MIPDGASTAVLTMANAMALVIVVLMTILLEKSKSGQPGRQH
jgi:hypothetical protein